MSNIWLMNMEECTKSSAGTLSDPHLKLELDNTTGLPHAPYSNFNGFVHQVNLNISQQGPNFQPSVTLMAIVWIISYHIQCGCSP